MLLIGQRWEYEIGNSRVVIDNAFSWTLWAQERFQVNDEVVSETSGGLRFSAGTKLPWLTAIGDSVLRLELQSRARGIKALATLDGEEIEPTAIYVARWRGGKGAWPEENAWSDQPPLKWVAN